MSLLLLFSSAHDETPAELPSEVTGRLFLAWGNLADTAVLSGGDWTEGLPLSNLKNRRSARVARSSSLSLAATQFQIDHGASAIWRVIALVGHNFAPDAEFRIRASSSPTFATVDYDSGWTNVWPSIFNTLDLDWSSDNFWSGRYTERQREGYKWTLILRPPRGLSSRYVWVEISDPNNKASYVQIERLFIADGWSPSRGMAFDARLGWADPSETQTAYGGAEVYNEKLRYRLAEFALRAVPEDETYDRAFELMRQAGTTREVLLMWQDNDTKHALRRQFVGRLERLSPIEHPYPDHQVVPLAVKETL